MAATDWDTFFLSRRVLYQTSSGVGSLPCHEYEYVLSANDMSNQDIANRTRRDGTGNRQNGTLLRGIFLFTWKCFTKRKRSTVIRPLMGYHYVVRYVLLPFFLVHIPSLGAIGTLGVLRKKTDNSLLRYRNNVKVVAHLK